MKIDNNIASPSVSLILLGVLKGYIKNPIMFLLKSKLTFNKFKKNIDFDLPSSFISSNGFIAHLYLRLKEENGNNQAFEIIRVCLLTTGIAVQQANFRNVEAYRTFDNLKKYQQEANKSGSTKLNIMEIIEESEKKYEFRITRCLFYELFSYLKVPELTTIFCSIDNAIFNSYLPEELVFHRNGLDRTLIKGYKYCEFVIENKQEM